MSKFKGISISTSPKGKRKSADDAEEQKFEVPEWRYRVQDDAEPTGAAAKQAATRLNLRRAGFKKVYERFSFKQP